MKPKELYGASRAASRKASSCPNSSFLLLILVIFVSSTTCLDPYDFIIVGGGTGGLAVTGRLLGANRNYSVLVLESGGYPKEGNEVPAYAPRFVPDTDVTFQYKSVPQQNILSRSNGSAKISSGRMVGGTSSLNFMHFNRGNPLDYDEWAKSTGDDSWSYSNLLPLFRKMETYVGDYPSDQHGDSGPIVISRPQYAPGLDTWLEAGRSLGYPIYDANGPQKISFTKTEFSKKFGRRASSYTSYIEPILASTPNLRILTNVNATQIMFSGKRAIGVKYETKSENSLPVENVAYARKEIIISAGSYGSPILLQKSGIGPRDVLEAAKVPVFHELPVGKNLQNHAVVQLDFVINNISAVIYPARDFTPENFELWVSTGDGPYSSAVGATGQAFLASSIAKSTGEKDWPDFQLTMAHSTESYFIVDNATSLFPEKIEVPMSVQAFVGRPKSRGSIKLNPEDPNGPPLIDPQHLMDPRDLQIALDGVKETIRIMETTESYKRLGARFSIVELEDCNDLPERSDEFLICYIKHLSRTGCHPSGSNKMGKGSQDPTAVVDSQLRVIGIDGLRVADASVMPTIVNANTQAAVYAIAERVSELILQRWQPSKNTRYGRYRFERKHYGW